MKNKIIRCLLIIITICILSGIVFASASENYPKKINEGE